MKGQPTRSSAAHPSTMDRKLFHQKSFSLSIQLRHGNDRSQEETMFDLNTDLSKIKDNKNSNLRMNIAETQAFDKHFALRQWKTDVYCARVSLAGKTDVANVEHCDVLSMPIDSDLVIYRTTLLRTFQVVTICRVDKSESTRSVLGKCVYLVTLAMSLFDLQDVCIAIGSIATLDLPMVVDLIGIYGLKGPYRTLTTTNWFLQALSVIPRGSWGDVVRRFTMIRWAGP
ncbi:plasma membrane ATPase 1-like [Dorcoceras hygrometricum]|uniref:Plasma membrane ATPase 1-like n=1 Tax=Dorcoceras hygrometricum TaxID=472368 RepID=A0A2Z7BKW9_9LAMI|nr:plasma membrane ATPase 1-like [Dorcoceras hygrometricum]